MGKGGRIARKKGDKTKESENKFDFVKNPKKFEMMLIVIAGFPN